MATPPRGLKPFYLVLGVAGVLGLAVLGYLVGRPPAVSIPVDVKVLVSDTAGFRGYLLGSDTAAVEIAEYADYQCPSCLQFEEVQFPDVKERLIGSGRVRWRYRDFPLAQHQFSRLAAHSAACADDQGRFWEQHALIYHGQPDWAEKRDASGTLRDYARQAGLDLAQYDACMTSAKYAGRIQASLDEGIAAGVNSTPTFLIGGRLYVGVQPYDRLKAVVDSLARPAK
ncbi:MAG: DsbA family protein [Gemmatimonadales bacterium]